MELECTLAESKRKQLLLGMWTAAKRRMFLLKLKSKYAGMMIMYLNGMKGSFRDREGRPLIEYSLLLKVSLNVNFLRAG